MNLIFGHPLNAAKESHDDEIGAIQAASCGDELATSEQLIKVNELVRKLRAEQLRASSLEALMVGLESHQGRYSDFELAMLQHGARRCGVTLPYRRLGVGLEAYGKGRAAALTDLTLESFKDHWYKAIETIIELLQHLIDFIRKAVLGQQRKNAVLLSYYRNYQAGKLPKITSSDIHVEGAVRLFSLHGKFDAKTIFKHQREVIDGLSDPHYHNDVIAFGKKVLDIIDRLLATPEEWRSRTHEITSLTVPIPGGFQPRSVQGALAEYESKPLLVGERLAFQTVAPGNTHGAKGAREVLAVIEKIGHVTNQGDWKSEEQYLDALNALGRSGVEAEVSTIMGLLESTDKLLKITDFSVNQLEDAQRKLKRIVKRDIDGDEQVNLLVKGLANAVVKVAALTTHLTQQAAKSVNRGAQAYVHLLHATLT